MPPRHPLRAELDHVGDQSHRGLDREAPLLLSDVLLENVGLDRPRELLGGNSLALSGYDIERKHYGRWRVDGHGGRNLTKGYATEERLHVIQRVDRDSLAAHFAERARVIGVMPHERRHVERGRAARRPVMEQVSEACFGLLGGAEAGELAHRPEATAVHGLVDAARVRVFAGNADLLELGQVGSGVQRLDVFAGDRGKQGVAPATYGHWRRV